MFRTLIGVAGAILLLVANASAQNLYVASSGNGSIYEFTPTGAESTFVSGLHQPSTLAFNSEGNLFVVCEAETSLAEITPSGAQSSFGSGLDGPVGLAINNAGDVFVANLWSHSITEITLSGASSTFASGLDDPYSLAFDGAGDLFMSDIGNNNIYEYVNEAGALSSSPIVFAHVLDPTGLAFDGSGDLFVASLQFRGGQGGITEIMRNGAQSNFASGTYPSEIAFNDASTLFELDPVNGIVYDYTSNGTQGTFVSGGLNGPAGLAFQGIMLPVPEPAALALLAVGGALLAAKHNRRICRFDISAFVHSSQQIMKMRMNPRKGVNP